MYLPLDLTALMWSSTVPATVSIINNVFKIPSTVLILVPLQYMNGRQFLDKTNVFQSAIYRPHSSFTEGPLFLSFVWYCIKH